jgi:riboflavin synthase
MFTGLVQDIGTVAAITQGPMVRLRVATALPARELELGESIALDGACLTVVARAEGAFEVEASPETLRRTTLGSWTPGTRVNLERALRLSDRLGGHLVQGHVDAVASILSKQPEGGSVRLRIELPQALAPLVIEKGSVAVDGVSLTVNAVAEGSFEVALIPETQKRTALAAKMPGARVNLETDVLGKYVARLLGRAPQAFGVSEELLRRAGFA